MNAEYPSALEREIEAIRMQLEPLLKSEAGGSETAGGDDLRFALIARWLETLSRRATAQERRSRELAKRVDSLEKGFCLVIEILRQLEDPYGYGESLDARLAAEGTPPPPDES